MSTNIDKRNLTVKRSIDLKIRQVNNDVIIEALRDFDLKQTLECGQCFRYECIGENEYLLVAKKRLIHVRQNEDTLIIFDTTLEEVDNVWIPYFDLERDYGEIKAWLLNKDDKIKDAIEQKAGVRILNQEFFEMLVTFIISQNKQIPQIKQIVKRISERFGEYIGEWDNERYYSFPTPEQLSKATVQDFLDVKAGFRAKYLVDACSKVVNKDIVEEILRVAPYEEALKKLQMINGVGEKVGNCILLFGLSRREAFPIDVWMIRIMETLYFDEPVKKEVMQQFAKEHFGEYGGYAQQYLFYYSRSGEK